MPWADEVLINEFVLAGVAEQTLLPEYDVLQILLPIMPEFEPQPEHSHGLLFGPQDLMTSHLRTTSNLRLSAQFLVAFLR
jgi:hypothetical protein